MDTRQDSEQDSEQDSVDLVVAAERLGLTVETVRKRLQRGKIRGYKAADNTWRVVLPKQDKPGHEAGQRQDSEQDKPGQQGGDLIAVLQDQVAFLRAQLQARDEEIRRVHILLQTSQQQVLQLTDQRQTDAERPERQGWLARLFGSKGRNA